MKKALSLIIVGTLIVTGVIALAGCSKTVDEPCDWCGGSPSIEYDTSVGVAYVCEECSSNCFFCDKKATTHYENMMGGVNFVCQDCFEGAQSW